MQEHETTGHKNMVQDFDAAQRMHNKKILIQPEIKANL